jgi:hypothetical protein
MLVCPNCGVELQDSSEFCPLCRTALHPIARRAGMESTYPDTAQDLEPFEGLSPEAKRKIFIEIFSVCSGIACFVVLAIELLISKRIWWSIYPVISVCFVWVMVCIPLILREHPWLVFAIIAPTGLAFVFLIDLLASGLSWFFAIGLPIGLLVEGASVGCVTLSVVSRRKGLNIIAIGLAGLAAICVGIEIVLNLNFTGRFFVSWSAVVATAALPIAGLLFYLHYRITKRASLKKLFRL